MTEKEFLISFFKEANMMVSESNFTMELALDVFKTRNNALKELRKTEHTEYNDAKRAGFEAGEKQAKELYEERLKQFDLVKNMTIQEIIDFSVDYL